MGGFVATKYLLEKGHKELGFLGAIDKSVSFYDRFLGYKKALEKAALSITKDYIINKSFEDLAMENSLLIAEELKKFSKLPTAFFCCNDIEAITLIKGLGAIGLQVPHDISVIGFDDIDLAKNFNPELTTIKVQKELLGIKAVQRLMSVIQVKDSNSEKLVLSISLLERQSVRDLLI
jgi:LacI family transcriptional regulator